MMARLPALIPALFLLLMAGAARAETEADLPRDPDFYYTYDPATQEPPPVPMPDLASRPKPRDSREFDGEPDPEGTLRFFVVGGESSSTCIGAPVSPLCAIETLMAGGMTGDIRLQKMAFGPFAKFYSFQDTLHVEERVRIYRVYDVKRIGPEDLKAPRPYGAYPWYPLWFEEERPWREGDLQIQILSMLCKSPDAETCYSPRVPITLTVREVSKGRWAVVDTYRVPL